MPWLLRPQARRETEEGEPHLHRPARLSRARRKQGSSPLLYPSAHVRSILNKDKLTNRHLHLLSTIGMSLTCRHVQLTKGKLGVVWFEHVTCST